MPGQWWKLATSVGAGLIGIAAILPLSPMTRVLSIAAFSLTWLASASRPSSAVHWARKLKRAVEYAWLWSRGGSFPPPPPPARYAEKGDQNPEGKITPAGSGGYLRHENAPLPGLHPLVIQPHLTLASYPQSLTHAGVAQLFQLFRQDFIDAWLPSVSSDPATSTYVDALLLSVHVKLAVAASRLPRYELVAALMGILAEHITDLSCGRDFEAEFETLRSSKRGVFTLEEWVGDSREIQSLDDLTVAVLSVLVDADCADKILQQAPQSPFSSSMTHLLARPTIRHPSHTRLQRNTRPLSRIVMACIDPLVAKAALLPLIEALGKPRILLRLLILIYCASQRADGEIVDSRAAEIADDFDAVLARFCGIAFPGQPQNSSNHHDQRREHGLASADSARQRASADGHHCDRLAQGRLEDNSLQYTVAARDVLLKHSVILYSVEMWRVYALSGVSVETAPRTSSQITSEHSSASAPKDVDDGHADDFKENWTVQKSREDIEKLHRSLSSNYHRIMAGIKPPRLLSSKKAAAAVPQGWSEASTKAPPPSPPSPRHHHAGPRHGDAATAPTTARSSDHEEARRDEVHNSDRGAHEAESTESEAGTNVFAEALHNELAENGPPTSHHEEDSVPDTGSSSKADENAVPLSSEDAEASIASVDEYFQRLIQAGLGSTQELFDFFSLSTVVEENRTSALARAAKKSFKRMTKVVSTVTAVVRVPVMTAVRAFVRTKLSNSGSRVVFVRRKYQSEEYDFLFRHLQAEKAQPRRGRRELDAFGDVHVANPHQSVAAQTSPFVHKSASAVALSADQRHPQPSWNDRGETDDNNTDDDDDDEEDDDDDDDDDDDVDKDDDDNNDHHDNTSRNLETPAPEDALTSSAATKLPRENVRAEAVDNLKPRHKGQTEEAMESPLESLSPGLLALATELFGLQRHPFFPFLGLINKLFSGIIDRWLVDMVDEQLGDVSLSENIAELIDTFWRDGQWIEDAPEIPDCEALDAYLATVAKECFPQLLPAWMKHVIGKQRMKDSFDAFIDNLRNEHANRVLIFNLLRVLVGRMAATSPPTAAS